MTWADLHTESERLAIEAQLALRTRNAGKAIELYKRAAEVERRALDQLDVSKARTRGITAVSAVALWFKAREYALVEYVSNGPTSPYGEATKVPKLSLSVDRFILASGPRETTLELTDPFRLFTVDSLHLRNACIPALCALSQDVDHFGGHLRKKVLIRRMQPVGP